MSIIRPATRTRYVVVEQSAMDDPRLSFDALGLLCYLLARPDSWEVRVASLAKDRRTSEYAVRKMLRELAEAGYAKLDHERDDTGRVQGSQWLIYERPEAATEIAKSAMSAPRLRKTESRQTPKVGKSDTLPNTVLGRTKTESVAREALTGESSSSFKAPKLDDVLTFAAMHGIRADLARKFFLHYQASGWLTRGGGAISDWRPKLQSWTLTEPGMTSTTANGPSLGQWS